LDIQIQLANQQFEEISPLFFFVMKQLCAAPQQRKRTGKQLSHRVWEATHLKSNEELRGPLVEGSHWRKTPFLLQENRQISSTQISQ
jgi:hypothetical protein